MPKLPINYDQSIYYWYIFICKLKLAKTQKELLVRKIRKIRKIRKNDKSDFNTRLSDFKTTLMSFYKNNKYVEDKIRGYNTYIMDKYIDYYMRAFNKKYMIDGYNFNNFRDLQRVISSKIGDEKIFKEFDKQFWLTIGIGCNTLK